MVQTFKGRRKITQRNKHLPEASVPLSWGCYKDRWFLLSILWHYHTMTHTIAILVVMRKWVLYAEHSLEDPEIRI